MIPADQKELLTAAVDGELSATEARAFRRLLDASPEARALYAKLSADRARVRALPQAAPPADLKAKILARIATATPRPVVVPSAPAVPAKPLVEPRSARQRTPAWVPVAAAACLLLGVTAVSFAYFNHQSQVERANAKIPWSDALPVVAEMPQAVPSPAAVAPVVRPDPDSIARSEVSPVPPLPHPRPVAPAPVAIAPSPREVAPPDFLVGPVLPPLPPFEVINVRIPFLRAVAELDRDDTRQELTDELKSIRETPYRFDLFVRDTARGVEVFQNAAKAAGLTVLADATTLGRLKNKQVTSVVVYTESYTAAELSSLFAKLCAEDMKFSPRVCDSLHVNPVTGTDESELKKILGPDVGLFKRAGNGGAGQGTPRDKPVSSGTIDSVTKTLTSPGAAVPEPTAILMTWQPTNNRTNPALSAELKAYKDKRGARKPNAVPAVIVIRLVG